MEVSCVGFSTPGLQGFRSVRIYCLLDNCTWTGAQLCFWGTPFAQLAKHSKAATSLLSRRIARLQDRHQGLSLCTGGYARAQVPAVSTRKT